MHYINHYKSPLGNILLEAEDEKLIGLWFEGKEYAKLLSEGQAEKKELEIFVKAKEWLDIYFAGKEPEFEIPLCFIGTDFQKEVWEILCTIPYGETVTYGDIAKRLAEKHHIKRMSAQAVGGAVGKNRISIIVPCHRVMGANDNLTGYGWGIEKKIALLRLEKVDVERFYVPN